MNIFTEIASLRHFLDEQKRKGKSVGFVPTMGALHQGHLSLIETARRANDLTVCSVFVNPTQFNNLNDLAVYPRTLATDSQMLEAVGCDVLFAPPDKEMYPALPQLKFDFGNLERVLEGEFRPGHFNGVGVVVSKLFHIVQPSRAYFGQKDLQQCLIIKRLVKDLSFDLELIICPTMREIDGLAMSSRNRNLTPEQRIQAPFIYEQLQKAKTMLQAGNSVAETQAGIYQAFEENIHFKLEYFSVADVEMLAPIVALPQVQSIALCIAAFLGKTRLIDNVVF